MHISIQFYTITRLKDNKLLSIIESGAIMLLEAEEYTTKWSDNEQWPNMQMSGKHADHRFHFVSTFGSPQ